MKAKAPESVLVETVARAIYNAEYAGTTPAAKLYEDLNWSACRKSARAAIDAHIAALRAAGLTIEEGGTRWLPIETAPTDEMFIYYWKRDGKRCIGLAYRTVSGDWRDSEGNWTDRIEPTHWASLPPATTEAKG